MGDIADWLMDSEMDGWEGENGSPWYTRQRKIPRCKYCGSSQVTWSNITGKWRLYTKGEPHTCAEYKKG